MDTKHIYGVIMAGGVGSRFWPLSTTKIPKQFLDILGTGKTLIQQTYARLTPLCLPENIYVVTHEDYTHLVQQQLPELKPHQILSEPSRKNTAPCTAYASFKILSKDKDAVLVVAPSDHLILKEQDFIKTIEISIQEAISTQKLITLGIKPSRPDTGYGYIQFIQNGNESSPVRTVKTFTEKPNLEMAEQFLESGDFYWNSGIFIWTAKSIAAAFEKHQPDLALTFKDSPYYFTPDESEFIRKVYAECVNISIDYAIMEKSNNVSVVLSDFGWSDLGTWGSVYTHINKDINANAVIANLYNLYDSANNIVYQENAKKMVVIEGLVDYIVVDTPSTLLICRKKEEQKIRDFVGELKISNKKFI